MANYFSSTSPQQTALNNKKTGSSLLSMYQNSPNPVSGLLKSSVASTKPLITPMSATASPAPQARSTAAQSIAPMSSVSQPAKISSSVTGSWTPNQPQTASAPTTPTSVANPNRDLQKVTPQNLAVGGDSSILNNAKDASGNPIQVGNPALNTDQGYSYGDTPKPFTPSTVFPTYPGLVSGLTNIGTQGSNAYNQAVDRLAQFDRNTAKQMGNIASEPIDLVFRQGRQQVLAQQAAAERAALQGAVQQQQTQQGQQIGALGTALGAVQPQLGQYGQTYYSPLAGGASGATPGAVQGTSQGQFDPNTQAQQYAQDVISGKRTYSDALSGMSLYGNAGKQILDSVIRGRNPNFNFAQAETLGAQQGSIGPTYEFAKVALQNVEDAIKQLGPIQGTNVPIVNTVGNYLSTQSGLGSEQTRAVTGAVQTLRNAYASLLASSRGGTPTDYSGQAQAEIPDNPTPNDIAAVRANFEKLGQARRDIYGQPGTGAPTSSGSTFSGLAWE